MRMSMCVSIYIEATKNIGVEKCEVRYMAIMNMQFY